MRSYVDEDLIWKILIPVILRMDIFEARFVPSASPAPPFVHDHGFNVPNK
jgi:hypothetical protein